MAHPSTLLLPLFSASPAQWVQAAFILTSSFVLAIAILPATERKLLLAYGPRRAAAPQAATNSSSSGQGTTAGDQAGQKEGEEKGDSVFCVVKKVTSLGQVPHSWFFTYYASYLVCAGFWATEYFQQGDGILHFIAARQAEAETASMSSTMGGFQVAVVWCLMVLQAGRRLYECWAVMKPSRSTMWFVHWMLGLGFYAGVSVAIWVEGSGMSSLGNALVSEMQLNIVAAAVLQNDVRLTGDGNLVAGASLFKTAVALPLFLYGWVMQHRCHKHLAGLRKYSLPEQGLFRYLVCPHYACECLIYLSLAVAAAPEGQWCNRTLLSVVVFVAVNLGVTAYGTRNWYVEKFGPQKVKSRWIMIPFLF